MKFLDRRRSISAPANGGNGCISFRRENSSNMASNGWMAEWGDGLGGSGGELNRHRLPLPQHITGESGGPGMARYMAGAKGPDAIMKVRSERQL